MPVFDTTPARQQVPAGAVRERSRGFERQRAGFGEPRTASRNSSKPPSSARLAQGEFEVDVALRRVRSSTRELKLGKKLVMLLACLMQEPGQVFSREQLRSLVWGPDATIGIRTIDMQIGRLRKALGDDGDGTPIKTARSAGYAFVALQRNPPGKRVSRS